jgi:5'-nucleotidase
MYSRNKHSRYSSGLPLKLQTTALLLAVATLWLLAGCTPYPDPHRSTLKILHINDSHSHLDASRVDLTLGDRATTCDIGGMARVAALIAERSARNERHLILHAGDTVQGTLYYTLFNGRADAAVLNAMGFDAITIGNHEFDRGDAWLADYIDQLDAPVISANIGLADGNVLTGKFSPYIIKQIGGKKIGIVGATIAGKTRQSSRPSAEVSFYDEASSVQAAVDKLKAAGVGKIILLSHCGFHKVRAMAPRISDIDVIVDGDSHSLLGNFGAYGLAGSGDYPTMARNANDEKVCIVQAWAYGKALGELDVTFRGDALESCGGNTHLILGETFTRQDSQGRRYTVEGDELAAIRAEVAADKQLDIVAEDPRVAAIMAGYATRVKALGRTVIGTAAEKLPHSRVPAHPHQGVNLALGSVMAPVVAKAFYEQDPRADLCIQNAGGIRIGIAPGDISYDTAYTMLPFSNTLFEIELYGREIKQVLEDALEHIAQGGSSGAFPYGYALRYAVDATRPYGKRISGLEYLARTSDHQYAPLREDALYVVLTNDYLATGHDGYRAFARAQAARSAGTDTYLDCTTAFINYVKSLTAQGARLRPLSAEERCLKRYIPTPDTTDKL